MVYRYCKNCKEDLREEGFVYVRPGRKFCDEKCRTRYGSKKRYLKFRDDLDFQNKKSNSFKKWYRKNKSKQHKSVLESYYKNKAKWKERTNSNNHRKKILKILSNKCHLCLKIGVKEIHHKKYGVWENLPFRNEELKNKILKKYCKNLLGFCSKKCHEKYHSIIKSK